MAANVDFIYHIIRKQTFSMMGEEQRVDVLCSRTSYNNEPCRDHHPPNLPGFLSVMRWPDWIVLTGIKILFVIETQTRIAQLGETLVRRGREMNVQRLDKQLTKTAKLMIDVRKFIS